MVSNEGIITTFGTTGTLGNLDDTVDKMHSGLIKTLWNTATGSRVVSSGTLTQSSGVFTLATPVIYRSQGTKITLGTTASHGQATVTANSTSNDRYDLLYIDQSGNSGTGQLSIATGTFNVNSPKVADLAKEDVPIAIIKVAAGAAASATHSFQVLMSTFNKDVLDDDEVTYAKIQNVSATNRILGRDSSGAGVIEEITPANLRTMINVADGATAYSDANAIAAVEGEATLDLTGDVTVANKKLTVDTTTLVVNAPSYTNRVGIGTATPSVELDVAGAITSSGTITGVIGALTTVNATDVNTANITSTANQNLSYEVITAATPISGLKTVVYSSAINGNTAALPAPASGNILTVVNLDAANPITLTGTPLINNGAVGHPKLTAPNVITLAPFEHVTLQAVNDTLGILQTGHIIISN